MIPMIPAFFVAFFSFTTALYMIDTGLHKTDIWYMLRWCAGSILFFLISAAFAWNGIFYPMPADDFDRYQCLYWSVGALMVYATIVWMADIKERRSKHRGR